MKQPEVNIYKRKRGGNFLMCMYSTDNVGKIKITKKKKKLYVLLVVWLFDGIIYFIC